MAESVGKILEILEIPEISRLYQTSIRKMQPAELVRRLDSEKVSTRGHMPELRGRLLRLEVQKSHPHLQVPWYPEDNVTGKIDVEDKIRPKNESTADDLLTKFFELTRQQEMQLRNIPDVKAANRKPADVISKQTLKAVVPDKVIEKSQTASGDNSVAPKDVPFHVVLEKLDSAMQAYLAQWEDTPINFEKKQLTKPTVEDSMIDESQMVFDENVMDEDQETTTTIDSDESIEKISSDHGSFEKLDDESIRSWDMDSWCGFFDECISHS